MTLLTVDNATVDYHVAGRRTVRAVAGASLEVRAGEIVGLVGESGCGKSTLGRAIAGLQKLSAGAIKLEGRTVAPLGARSRPVADRGIQMVFQDPFSSLNPRRRIGRQIADGLPAGTSREVARREVGDLLASVGLSREIVDRYPHEFSGGQRQRIAIARALAARPTLMVADEPVSALDASTRAQVSNLLAQLAQERQMGLLLISHDLSGVRHVADRVAVMYLGRVVEIAPTESVWGRPLHPYSDALIKAIPQLGRDAVAPQAPVGEVPDPSEPPSGCRFHPRCPLAMPRCASDDPALTTLDADSQAACWLQDGGVPVSVSSVAAKRSETST